MPTQKYSRPDGYAQEHIHLAMVSYVHKQSVDSVCFSPDGRFLATGGTAGMVWIWEVARRQIVASFAAHTEGPDYRKNDQEWALGDIDWSSDGRYLITCGRDPYTVKLREVQITG